MKATIEHVHDLAPAIRKRSQEIEHARRLPLDLVADLTAAGCFRMLVPRAYGGDELPLASALQVFEELSAIDGSTGWTTMIGAGSPILFGLLPKAGFEAIYIEGPDVIGAGALAPKGRAMAVTDGYCISGQWSFASGCQHASWLLSQSMVVDSDGAVRTLPTGVPMMRVAVFPAHQAEILDTWHVAGMRGTGSNDFRLNNVFCPDERTYSLFGATASIEGRVYRIPTLAVLPVIVSAVALGIGRGAIEDIAELASGGKRRVFATSNMAQSAVFQDRLGEADATLRAARALLYSEVESAWHKAGEGGEFSTLDRARLRATGPQVATMVTQVVDAVYAAGGGSSIYDTSPLQRRLRDIHTLTQHIGVSREAYSWVGALLAGEELAPGRPI